MCFPDQENSVTDLLLYVLFLVWFGWNTLAYELRMFKLFVLYVLILFRWKAPGSIETYCSIEPKLSVTYLETYLI